MQLGKWCRMHPSGASGTDVEVFPAPAQFKLRMPEAILHFKALGREVFGSVGSVSVVLGSVDRF
eukprot:5010734-Alexandrium_andersonii.AAC.1